MLALLLPIMGCNAEFFPVVEPVAGIDACVRQGRDVLESMFGYFQVKRNAGILQGHQHQEAFLIVVAEKGKHLIGREGVGRGIAPHQAIVVAC